MAKKEKKPASLFPGQTLPEPVGEPITSEDLNFWSQLAGMGGPTTLMAGLATLGLLPDDITVPMRSGGEGWSRFMGQAPAETTPAPEYGPPGEAASQGLGAPGGVAGPGAPAVAGADVPLFPQMTPGMAQAAGLAPPPGIPTMQPGAPVGFAGPSAPPQPPPPPPSPGGGMNWWDEAATPVDPVGVNAPAVPGEPEDYTYAPMQEPGTPWGGQEFEARDRIQSLVDLMGAPPDYPAMEPAKLSPLQAILSGLADVLYTQGRGTHMPASMHYLDRAQRRATSERDKQFQAARDAAEAKYTAGLRGMQAELGLARDDLQDARSQRREDVSRQQQLQDMEQMQENMLERIQAQGVAGQKRTALAQAGKRAEEVRDILNNRPPMDEELAAKRRQMAERFQRGEIPIDDILDLDATAKTRHELSKMPYGQAQDINAGLRGVENDLSMMKVDKLLEMERNGILEPVIRRMIIKSEAGGISDELYEQNFQRLLRQVRRRLEQAGQVQE